MSERKPKEGLPEIRYVSMEEGLAAYKVIARRHKKSLEKLAQIDSLPKQAKRDKQRDESRDDNADKPD